MAIERIVPAMIGARLAVSIRRRDKWQVFPIFQNRTELSADHAGTEASGLDGL